MCAKRLSHQADDQDIEEKFLSNREKLRETLDFLPSCTFSISTLPRLSRVPLYPAELAALGTATNDDQQRKESGA